MDLLPLELAGRAAEPLPPAGTPGEGLLVVALPGDDAWVGQLRAAAAACPGAPLLAHAPGRTAAAVARAAGLAVEVVGWEAGLRRARAYVDAGPARLACEARRAGVAVVEHPRDLPAPTVPLPGRVAQVLYLVDQVRRQRGRAAVWLAGDAELEAAVTTLPGTTRGLLDPCAPLLDVAIVPAGLAIPGELAARMAPGALLLVEVAGPVPPAFEALGTDGWQVLRRGPRSRTPLTTPIQRIVLHFHARPEAGARRFARALARLGYEVLVVGEGQAELGGHELPSGASLPAFLAALGPEWQPDLYLFLAAPGDQPPAGVHQLELPAMACFLTPAERRGDLAATRDFDHAGVVSPEAWLDLAAKGHRGAFFLPASSRMGFFEAVEPTLGEARSVLVDEAHRMRAIALLEAVQTAPSRGLTMLAGHQRFSAGDLAGAMAHFEAAALHERPSAEAFVNLGVCSHALGHLGDAIALFRAALAIAPDHVAARENLAALG